MNITLRNVHFSERFSDETNCFDGVVYVDGKRMGEVRNDGRGGPNEYYFDTKELDAHCKTLPMRKLEGLDREFHVELDDIVDDLFMEWLRVRDLKRMTKGKTCFRLKTDKPDQYRQIPRPFGSEIRAHVVAKYGDQLEGFLNEDPAIAGK